MCDDATLLQRYAANQAEEAFAEIVRRHLDAVYSAALRRVGGDTHLAEDVTQQVFVALARKAHAVARHPFLSAWLYVTTRNEAANAVRHERRRKLREQEAHAMDEITDRAVPADWSRLAPVLDQVIDGLGAADRTAILLRFIEHRSFAQIGAALRLSEDAARMRTDRALDKLRRSLTQRGIASTSAALGAALADHAVAAAPSGLAQAVTVAALATPPATLGTAVSILQFMSTTKVIAGAMGALVLIAAGIAVHEDLALREANTALAIAGHENDDLAAKLAAAQGRTDAIEREAADLQAAIDSKRAAKAAEERTRASAAAQAGAARPNAESMAAGRDFVNRHPEVHQAVLDYHHDMMMRLFGGFYRERGFSDEQIKQFESVNMAAAGVFKMIPGVDGQLMLISTPTFGDPEKRKEENQQLMALLGDEGIRQIKEYQSQIPGRQIAAQLAGDLYYTATPLTAAQADQFVRAVAAAGGRGAEGEFSWDAIFTGARSVLAQPQLDALQAIAAKRTYETALGQAMRRSTTPVQNAANPATKS